MFFSKISKKKTMNVAWSFKSNLFGCYLGFGTIGSSPGSAIELELFVAVASMVVEVEVVLVVAVAP